MIVTKIKKLRDPFIVLHEGDYYAYGNRLGKYPLDPL